MKKENEKSNNKKQKINMNKIIINNKKQKKENKIKYLTYITIVLLIIFFIILSNNIVFASTPKLVNKMQSAFEDIEKWLVKLATPAAAVTLATGVFMKKFSFGDEERMRAGKKVIRTALFSYAFILAIDLILAAIKSLI